MRISPASTSRSSIRCSRSLTKACANEVTAFFTSQRESEDAQRGLVQRIRDENLRVLTLSNVNDWERTKAAQKEQPIC